MAQSLQDQLLKAGLVTEKQVQDSRRKDPRGRKQNKKAAKKARPPQARSVVVTATTPSNPPTSEREREVARQRAAKVARDRALNQNRVADAERKARRAQVRQLVQSNEQKQEPGADVPYNFQRGRKIKRIYVTASQRQQLLAGSLAVVAMDNAHHFLEPSVAARVLEMAPDAWMHRHDPTAAAQTQATPGEDPYAGFEVPDDLMW